MHKLFLQQIGAKNSLVQISIINNDKYGVVLRQTVSKSLKHSRRADLIN